MHTTDLIAQARAATFTLEDGRIIPLGGATVTLSNGATVGVSLIPAVGRICRRRRHDQARFYVDGKLVPRPRAEALLAADTIAIEEIR